MRPLLLLVSVLVLFAVPVSAQAPLSIDLNLPTLKLVVREGDRVVETYPVAVGMPGFDTPTGKFAVSHAEWNPWWTPPTNREWARDEKRTPPGPNNPMGRVKLFFMPLYFIHGTPDGESIGTPASHGCVRMRNPDVIELAKMIHERVAPQVSEADLNRLVARPGPTRRVNFQDSVSVVIRYDPVVVEGSEIMTYPDIYRRNAIHTEAVYQALLAAGYDVTNLELAAVRRYVDRVKGQRVPVVMKLDEVFGSAYLGALPSRLGYISTLPQDLAGYRMVLRSFEIPRDPAPANNRPFRRRRHRFKGGFSQARLGGRPVDYLVDAERSAIRLFVWRVLNEVPAQLVEAALFGSTARGEARSNSDLDILLIFRDLPPDREPQAGLAENIAEEVAARTGMPLTAWSVALCDLARGNRTPMLVDALEDAKVVWCWPAGLEPVPFTPEDACRCAGALLSRVSEGSREFAAYSRAGDWTAAARRTRDDLVRLCTAILLLHGITRPRRAEAVEEVIAILFRNSPAPVFVQTALDWAMLSFGPSGRGESLPVSPPKEGFRGVARAIDFLRDSVIDVIRELPRGDSRPIGSTSV